MHLALFLGLFSLSIFLTTGSSLILWNNVPLLSFALYPWRFLAIVVFASAVLSSWITKVAGLSPFLIVLLIGLLTYSNRNYSQLVGKVYEQDSYYYNYQDTADIWGEYLPTTANLKIIETCRVRGCRFEKITVPNNSKTEVIATKSNLLKVSYDSPKDFTATINTFYFPGWNSYLDGAFYEGIEINENGTMDISLPRGKHELTLRFEDTAFRKIALLISLVGMAGSGVYALWLRKYLKG